MNPSELQASDPIKKRHKIDQAIEAFKAHKWGSRRNQAEFDLPLSYHREPSNIKFDGSGNGPISSTPVYPINNATQSPWTPNASTVPALSSVATPADSITEMYTPESNNLFANSLDKSNYIARSSITPRSAQSPAHVTLPDSIRKRPAPSDFDPKEKSTSRKKSNFRFSGSTRPEESSLQAIDPEFMTGVRHDPRADTYSGRKKKKGNKGKLSTIAELEDKMMVPRDFLGYIKRLTINRFSAVSALSSSGPPWSRKGSTQNQSDFVQPGQEAGHNLPIRQPSSKEQPEHEWRQVSFPKTVDGRPHTDLFRVLESGEYSEEEIGDKLEALIAEGAGPNIRNRNGETPLHVALTLGNSFACKVLLDGGADVHVKTWSGKSLTEYGRDAEKRMGEDVKRYVAIKACRKLIFEHDPKEKRTKASKSSMKINNAPHEHKDDGLSSESQGGPSGMRVTSAFSLGEAELRQATPTREASLSHVEDAMEVSPGHNSSPTNFSNGYTIGNFGALRSTTNDIMQEPQGSCNVPALSFPDQTINPPPRQTSPVVRDLVGFWERSHSTNSSSDSQIMQGTNLDGGYNEESLLAQLSNAPQSFNDSISHTINTGHTEIYRHRRTPNVLGGLRNLPIGTQQGPHAFRNERENVPQSSPRPKPPAQLTGYLQQLPTGQWALVCPLSTDDAWRYVEQEGDINSFSPAVIQIVARPEIGLVPSMTVPQPYNASNGGPSTLAAAQEEALSQTTMLALPTWSHVEPLVQPNPVTIPSNPVQNTRPTTISPSNARGVSSLNNAFLDAWEHIRPGIPPRAI